MQGVEQVMALAIRESVRVHAQMQVLVVQASVWVRLQVWAPGGMH